MSPLFVLFVLGAASAVPLPDTSRESLYKRRLLENPKLYQGDIVLPKGVHDRNAIVGRRSLWPNGVIPYVIDKRLASASTRIRNAMKYIESLTCIRFKLRERESDYVSLYDGDGCYSYVGRVGDKQELSLENGCRDRSTIVHELMHAIGFYHQHERSDRDQFVDIIWRNIDPDQRDQFELLKPHENNLYTPFDYMSIMLYGPTTFSKDGRSVTMVPKTKGVRLLDTHQKPGLSPNDVKAINTLYQCK